MLQLQLLTSTRPLSDTDAALVTAAAAQQTCTAAAVSVGD